MPEQQIEIERRSWHMERIEIRTVDGDGQTAGQPLIVGYAAVFDQLSDDLGGFRERILRGAFRDALGDDVRALWNHDSNYVLGRTTARTLSLLEDIHGLRVEIAPPDTSWARDLMTSIRRGDVSQMSFGFTVPQGGSEFATEAGTIVRTLRQVRLFDVSPVTFPAYSQTTVQVRSLVDDLRAQSDSSQPGEARARLALRRRTLQLTEVEM